YWRCQRCEHYYPSAKNCCLSCQKKRTRGPARSTVWELGPWPRKQVAPEGQILAPEGLNPDDIIEVRRAVQRLPSDLQELIRMRHYNGMSVNEIVRETGRPLGEVQESLQVAMQQLRKDLE